MDAKENGNSSEISLPETCGYFPQNPGKGTWAPELGEGPWPREPQEQIHYPLPSGHSPCVSGSRGAAFWTKMEHRAQAAC